MSVIENLFDEDLLLPNLKGIAFFILLYEHFEDAVISVVKEFYSLTCVLDGQLYCDIDDQYIKALKKKIDDQDFTTYELLKIGEYIVKVKNKVWKKRGRKPTKEK